MSATIGHNQPPEATPFETVRDEIDALYAEAKGFLDGEPITTQPMADAVGKLLNLIRAAEKRADEHRKAEVKPLDDAKSEIQARYNALIGQTKSVTGKTVLAAEACKQALKPFLMAQEQQRQEAEAKARAEAARLAAEAQAQLDASRQSADLSAREDAETAIQQAKQAEADANRIGKDTARAKGDGQRAVSLRPNYRAEVTDAKAFAAWAWVTRRDELTAWLGVLAQKEVDASKRDLPGVTVHEERSVV
jgi:hypothetical protein